MKVTDFDSNRRTAIGRRRGMTLIELSIVIVVLGIIIGLVTYGLRTAGAGVQAGARKLQVEQQANNLRFSWTAYQDEFGQMNEGDNLLRLTKKDPEHPNWRPLEEKDVVDPWGEAYYVCRDQDQELQLCSKGADKKEGGVDQNADFMLTRKDTWPTWLTGKKAQ